MLSEEQTTEIKKQIFQQIESWPEEQRESARAKIEAMSPEEFEEFLIKNKMIKGEGDDAGTEEGERCVFCSIVEKKIPSSVVAEHEKALAVLEINPVSKGHTIVIPKKHVLHAEDLDMDFMLFVKSVAVAVREGTKANTVDRWAHAMMGHLVVNLIPVYGDTKLDFPRKKGDVEELKKSAAWFKELFDQTERERKEKERVAALQTQQPQKIGQAPFRRP